jgi:RND superfamily putative drug exporter
MLLAAIAVALAFGATLLSPVDWIPPLGYGGLIGIPIVLAAALTLTPCLLILLGDRFFALGRTPLSDLEQNGAVGRHLRRTAEFARRRKVTIVLVFLAVTVPFALVVADTRSTADPVALSPATDSREGFATVADRWGDAAVLPTAVVGGSVPGAVENGALSAEGLRAVAALTDRLGRTEGVRSVDSATHPFGTLWSPEAITAMPQSLRDDYVARDGSLRFVLALDDDPYSERAADTVQRVEKVAAAARADVGNLDVGGATEVDRQYGDALRTSFWQMIVLVSIGVFVLLVIALRSLLVPVRLIATIMLSNVWAVGLTVLIFHHWRGEAIIDDLPIFLTVLMMGLGMDYEIFLVTRVRDLARSGLSQEEATLQAVMDTGRVINAAGLVMAGSLGTMALSSTLMLQQYGTGLGLAVLLDATLIRMLFVPATLLLFRKYNWWLPRFGRAERKTLEG